MSKKVLQELNTLIEATDDMLGYCLACGYEQDSVEPDACKYTCEECGKNQVYGAEELILMGEHK